MGFLNDYMLYCDNMESPALFSKWSALGALSALAGRRFWFSRGRLIEYTNLYILLVGDPGHKKSTSMYVAKDLIRNIKVNGKQAIQISASSSTKEAFCQNLSKEDMPFRRIFSDPKSKQILEYTQCAIFATEFVHFIGTDALKWIDFFTTVYDERVYTAHTKNKGNDDIPGPYITLLGCMTPELTGQLLKASILSGGFSRRTVFIWADRPKKRIAIPEISKEEADALLRCRDHGIKMQKYGGEFEWENEDTVVWYRKWYDELCDFREANKIKCMVPWYASKDTMLLKIAMLLSLSEGFDMKITIDYLQAASILLEEAEHDMPRVFTGSGPNLQTPIMAEIERTLIAIGKPVKYKELFSMFLEQASQKEFDIMLDELSTLDLVKTYDKILKMPNGTQISIRVVADIATFRREEAEREARMRQQPVK